MRRDSLSVHRSVCRSSYFEELRSTAWPVLALVDFENDAHARLHDEAMAELAKYLERKAAENKVKAEERRQALEARKTSSCS